MRVGWLIDAEIFESYHDELSRAVRGQGHQVASIRRPKPPYEWDDVDCSYRNAFPPDTCVVTHADIELTMRVLSDQLWTPGAFASVDHFHCSNYYPHFKHFLLNSQHAILPFGELPRRRSFLFGTLGKGGLLFVRPDSPLKLFSGLTISRDAFESDYEYMGFGDVPSESLVVVSPPQRIIAEWRFVVADHQIVSGSLYSKEGVIAADPDFDSGALEFAEKVVAVGYEPDPVWVLDICQTEDRAFHLLEIGAFSFAYLYACDMNEIVKAVSQAAWSIYKDRHG